MTKPLNSSDQLMEQQDAVESYLSALLSDVSQTKMDHESSHVVTSVLAELATDIRSENIDCFDNEFKESAVVNDKFAASVIPDYLQKGFQSLSFAVSNIKLCVPLQQLNGIVDWNGEFSRLPGQAKWCIGLMHSRDRYVNIVDLYGLLNKSPSHFQLNTKLEEKPGQYLLLVGNSKWGLACDSVDTISLLYHNDINWRASGASEFIMGTEINGMRLILNAEEMVRRLEDSSV